MLRVVWIVPGFSSSENDWCIPALLDLAREIGKGCDLHIVAMRYPYRRDSYRIGTIQVHSIGGAHRGPLYTPPIWSDTARSIRKLNADILHAFWAYEPGVIAACFSGLLPVVITLAGGELVSLPQINYGLGKKRRTRLPIAWALRRAHMVTAGSRYLMGIAERQHPLRSLNYMPLGVDLKRWAIARHDTAPPIILSVGSLEPVKGHAMLLEAFAGLAAQFPSALLRIVGAGQEETRLRQLARRIGIAERAEFTGAVPHEELPAHYAGAALFVQSSWHEAQGIALLEAAACGLPLVGTEVGALKDLSPDAAIGTSVGDTRALADGMRRILMDREEAMRLGRNGREKVESVYRVEKAAERFLGLYHSCL